MIHFNQLYQHYRSTPDVLVPTDKITVKLLKPGSTLVWNSYGYRFVNHIPDLHIYDDFQKSNISLDRTFDNIVIVNPMVLRYTTTTELSDKVSKDMKQRGLKFVGSTTIYAHLQAIGVVNDHVVECFRY
jgi:hypothetical protein